MIFKKYSVHFFLVLPCQATVLILSGVNIVKETLGVADSFSLDHRR